MAEKPGTLYLCATPIGNLEDMTLRAIRILKEVSVIAAEDTRYTRRLLTHFDIHTPLISYHEHNKASRGPELIARLAAGEDIAVVSDAGLPGISDPGADLVRLALPEGIAAVPLPGCNAALSALICSGLDSTMFTFVGFLPKTKKKRREFLENLAKNPYTLLMYEAPHRLRQTLNELHEILGDRPAVAARELTKRFEQFVRGTIGTLQDHFAAHLPRGEFTLVIAGCPAAAAAETAMDMDEVSLQDAVFALVAQGTDKKNAIRIIAEQRSLPKRVVYQAVLDAGK
ncbi:MAG: Ribosomal small subunit methyltransferase [Firmicutes bacterium]|nr:Ribosomal small subunit methyltransferase [Bacillota bacterium]